PAPACVLSDHRLRRRAPWRKDRQLYSVHNRFHEAVPPYQPWETHSAITQEEAWQHSRPPNWGFKGKGASSNLPPWPRARPDPDQPSFQLGAIGQLTGTGCGSNIWPP